MYRDNVKVKLLKIVFGIFLGALVFLSGVFLFAPRENSRTPELVSSRFNEQNRPPPSPKSQTQTFILNPGEKPVIVETNGRKYRQVSWDMGQGEPVLLLRIILLNGEIVKIRGANEWANICGQHLDSQDVPAWGVTKSLEFCVPKGGRSQKVEVTIM